MGRFVQIVGHEGTLQIAGIRLIGVTAQNAITHDKVERLQFWSRQTVNSDSRYRVLFGAFHQRRQPLAPPDP